MTKILPEISKQIGSEEIRSLLEDKYSQITPLWMPLQLQWMNSAYFMIMKNL